MVRHETRRAINSRALFGLPIFVVTLFVLCGCGTDRVQAPLAKINPTSTSVPPTATFTASPCALHPLPDRTPIVRPTFTPMPPQIPVLTGRSQIIDTTFKSPLLDRTVPILVYLPPGYSESNRHYPTLFMLGGFTGDYREWSYWGICQALEALTRAGKIQPMIVVMPEGDGSYWFNHALVPNSDGKPWGDYIWHDVVDFVDKNFRTLPQPQSRAIGGLSAGGQGALMLGLTHPEVFSIVGAHSPSMRGADGSIAYFGDRDYFNQYDPLWLIDNTKTWQQLTIWIDIGHDDTQWGGVIVQFHDKLDKLGVKHDFVDSWYGVHEDSYWSAHLPDYLMWYSSKLAGE